MQLKVETEFERQRRSMENSSTTSTIVLPPETHFQLHHHSQKNKMLNLYSTNSVIHTFELHSFPETLKKTTTTKNYILWAPNNVASFNHQCTMEREHKPKCHIQYTLGINTVLYQSSGSYPFKPSEAMHLHQWPLVGVITWKLCPERNMMTFDQAAHSAKKTWLCYKIHWRKKANWNNLFCQRHIFKHEFRYLMSYLSSLWSSLDSLVSTGSHIWKKKSFLYKQPLKTLIHIFHIVGFRLGLGNPLVNLQNSENPYSTMKKVLLLKWETTDTFINACWNWVSTRSLHSHPLAAQRPWE